MEKLQITIHGVLDPAKLFGQEDPGRAGFNHIHVDIEALTNAHPELEKRWIHEIKSRCPIHDNLVTPTPVSINFIDRKKAEYKIGE